jgi:CBS domain-containing protein
MNVEELMTGNVRTCCPNDPLSDAARIMWEADCGCVPVTEECYGSAKVVGMITDRDICMAAYTQGLPLSEIEIGSVMATTLCSCRMTDSIATALKILEQNQIHRLLVLDQDDTLMGLLSLTDIAREAKREHGGTTNEVSDAEVGRVVEAISAPRSPGDVACAA